MLLYTDENGVFWEPKVHFGALGRKNPVPVATGVSPAEGRMTEN